jgi:hypothetical protein
LQNFETVEDIACSLQADTHAGESIQGNTVGETCRKHCALQAVRAQFALPSRTALQLEPLLKVLQLIGSLSSADCDSSG